MVLQTISDYKLSFSQHPPRQVKELPELFSTDLEQQVCHQEISRLCDVGAVEPVRNSEDQFLSLYFVIQKSSGGWRFILNLKLLNNFIVALHFKMEDWKTVVQLLSLRDFLASIDLKDAYLFLPIHQDDRKFLCF